MKEMGRAYGTIDGEERCVKGSVVET